MATAFLASVLGWYLVIMALFLILRRNLVIAAVNDIMAQSGLLFVVAFITLIIGLMIVVTHNVWVMSWPVIITIIGWLALISGIIRLFCPEFIHRMWGKMAANPGGLTISGIIMLLIGLFLLFKIYFI
jgi:hypothetical protein